MKKWLRRTGRMTIESLPLCGLLTLLNPALIMLGDPGFEFPLESWLILGGVYLLLGFCLGILMSIVPDRFQSWAINGLRSLFLVCFLITIFYPEGGRRLDGVAAELPSIGFLAGLYIAYIATFLVLLVALRKFKDKTGKAFAAVLFLCVAIIGYGVITKTGSTPDQLDGLDLNYAKEKNIIFILADALQGSTVEQYFSITPDAAQQFEGFSAFTRAISPFPFTAYSMAAMLTGRLYAAEGKPDYEKNFETARSSSFIVDAAKKGYTLAVVGGQGLEVHPEQIFYKPLPNPASTSFLLLDLGMTRITKVPNIINLGTPDIAILLMLKIQSLKIMNRMSTEKKGRSPNKLFFIHNYMTHTPIYFEISDDLHLFPVAKPLTSKFYMDETKFFFVKIITPI